MIRTYLGIAHPWLCDAMGHLNTRHYVAMFDDASAHYLAAIGWDPGGATTKKVGWADVRGEIEYRDEVVLAGQVTIDTGTEAVGTKSLTILSEMRDSTSGDLKAVMRSVIVHFDLVNRRAIEIPPEYRAAAESIKVQDES